MAVKIEVDISEFHTRKMDQLLDLLHDKSIRSEVNLMIGNAINDYVPMKTGALKRSLRAYPEYISWGTGLRKDRVEYQYTGIVYKKNYPIMKNKVIVGWYSKGDRYPSTEMLGEKQGQTYKGWTFGYSTPGTQSQWLEVYHGTLKSQTNLAITRFLKRKCKNRGLNV